METDQVSETCIPSEYEMMDKIRKLYNPECNVTSQEPLTINFIFVYKNV
jgi:hypothetical protein